ncbi:MAG TPA: sodium:solute symporter [Pyrinomonadaceae bacterium]|nr:sodium:solute symporter [Pyrinomonadaceae bacterium]HMP65973.1 sodium:solute symporter [Pyrinomonadaceae bacterium]
MGFSALDYVILIGYLIGITAFGVMFRKTQKSATDYFVGNKNTHWFVICASIVATETSTLTLIGIPAIAYAMYANPEQGGNFAFLQIVFGYIIARFIISVLFIPAYYKGDLLTAYKLLENRFGGSVKNFAASLFLFVRAVGDGVRTFAASIVIAAVLAFSLPDFPQLAAVSILIVGILTLIYTYQGGLIAVLWTDLIQLVIYVSGAIIAAIVIWNSIPGGWAEISTVASEADKFRFVSFALDFTIPFTFWAGLIGGTFLTTASHGTDQMLVQRLLACRNEGDAKKAIITSGFVILFQFALLLFVGVLLYVFYAHFPVSDAALSASNCVAERKCDGIFPKFIVEQLPTGVAGLMIAALTAAAMSTLSSSLNSLASSSILDFYKPLINPNADETKLLKLSRWLTAVWGIILIGIAFLSQGVGSVLTVGLSIASLIYGPMLGAFLLGVLTKRANGNGVIAGMLASLVSMVLIWNFTPIAWTWYVLIGTSICFSVGYLVSQVTGTGHTTAEGGN